MLFVGMCVCVCVCVCVRERERERERARALSMCLRAKYLAWKEAGCRSCFVGSAYIVGIRKENREPVWHIGFRNILQLKI